MTIGSPTERRLRIGEQSANISRKVLEPRGQLIVTKGSVVWSRLAIVGVDLDVAVIGTREARTMVGIGAYWVALAWIPFLGAVRMCVTGVAGGAIGRALSSASACGWSVRPGITGAGRTACITGVSA